jgi:hypothetical protein
MRCLASLVLFLAGRSGNSRSMCLRLIAGFCVVFWPRWTFPTIHCSKPGFALAMLFRIALLPRASGMNCRSLATTRSSDSLTARDRLAAAKTPSTVVTPLSALPTALAASGFIESRASRITFSTKALGLVLILSLFKPMVRRKLTRTTDLCSVVRPSIFTDRIPFGDGGVLIT